MASPTGLFPTCPRRTSTDLPSCSAAPRPTSEAIRARFASRPIRCRGSMDDAASAARFEVPTPPAASSFRNFKSKSGVRTIYLLVPLCFRSSCCHVSRTSEAGHLRDAGHRRCRVALPALFGLLAPPAAVGAAAFFFGGFYSVAAPAEDPAFVKWALIRVRMASIDRHATDQPPAKLDDPALVEAGARAFATRGCVNCHGAPGVEGAKFSEGVWPAPHGLNDVVDHHRHVELSRID